MLLISIRIVQCIDSFCLCVIQWDQCALNYAQFARRKSMTVMRMILLRIGDTAMRKVFVELRKTCTYLTTGVRNQTRITNNFCFVTLIITLLSMPQLAYHFLPHIRTFFLSHLLSLTHLLTFCLFCLLSLLCLYRALWRSLRHKETWSWLHLHGSGCMAVVAASSSPRVSSQSATMLSSWTSDRYIN